MIDNFASIPDLCQFNEHNFYKFFLMIRKKDVGEHPLITSSSQENIVKFWLIDSEKYLNKKMSEMKFLLSVIPGARLYMVLDAKNGTKTLITMRSNVDKILDALLFGNNLGTRYLNRVVSSSTSAVESSAHDSRKYLFDVDSKDQEVLNSVLDFLKNVDELKNEKVLTLETKNGYHVVVPRRFDPSKYPSSELVTLKKDAAVLIAMS